jgi:predicted PolB exonuclease-like 3'-5' exonuclease
MFKNVSNDVWVFDAEWAPDPMAGRLLYELDDDLNDKEVVAEMFRRGGATPENPTPFLKIALCRVVSVVAVVRRVSNGEVSLRLTSLPKRGERKDEHEVLKGFLEGVGKFKPQIVGYNSLSSDIRIFLQRAIINGIQVQGFLERPDKPWNGPDYFAKGNDYHVDLYQLLHSWGGGGPSLNEIATLSGIPGKLDCDGQQVYDLWLQGRIDEIVAYNECDALSTYLLWLRCAFAAGFFNKDEYSQEQMRVDLLLEAEIERGAEHLKRFLEKWKLLRQKKQTY